MSPADGISGSQGPKRTSGSNSSLLILFEGTQSTLCEADDTVRHWDAATDVSRFHQIPCAPRWHNCESVSDERGEEVTSTMTYEVTSVGAIWNDLGAGDGLAGWACDISR